VSNLGQHSSIQVEHYTPIHVVEAARATMGAIDLDPATCSNANEVVKAKLCFGPDWGTDGLLGQWCGDFGEPLRVFLNPPGGVLNRRTLTPLPVVEGKASKKGLRAQDLISAATVWWGNLLNEYETGNVHQAVFVAFSLNIFQNAQSEGLPCPASFPFCIPNQRLEFWGPGKRSGPSHPNAVVYLPPKDKPESSRAAFAHYFGSIGAVRL